MRIVIFGGKGLPGCSGSGGVERGVYEVAQRLASWGHDVIVYERATWFATRIEDGLTVRSIPFINSKRLSGWSHAMLSMFDSLLRFRSASIYHVHNASNGFFCVPLRLLTRGRIIFHIHGAEWQAKKWGAVTAMLFRASCIMGALASHEVASVCARAIRELSTLPGLSNRIWLVPNGVPRVEGSSLANGRLNISDPPFLLYAGRLVPQKRVDLLIRAFKLIDANASLLIAGPDSHCDDYVETLKDLARHDPRITFAGALNFGILTELYRCCTAVVLPSDTEGCSNVLLEALGHGCCIVTSDIPENLVVVGQAALSFKAGNIDALIQALRRITRDSAEVIRLRQLAIGRSRQLVDWDEVTSAFIRLYRGEHSSGQRVNASSERWGEVSNAPERPATLQSGDRLVSGAKPAPILFDVQPLPLSRQAQDF